MVKNKNRKNKHPLSHYPRFLASQLVFRTMTWSIFLVGFIGLGKKYCQLDILGKIANFFGLDWDFHQNFLGTSDAEKIKLLNIAFYFTLVIIFLNWLSLLINVYFWKKDRYLENNNFYLHQRSIFIINSLICIASVFLLTFSFVSALTIILTLLFITFNSRNYSFFFQAKTYQLENFFTWKNPIIRKVLFYSALIVLIVPFVLGSFRTFVNKAMGDSPEGLAKTLKELINSSGTMKSIVDLIIGSDFSFFHWFVLLYFSKNLITARFQEFSSFWTKVNSITTQASNYCRFYYYRESWALVNNTPINLGDYNYLQNSPSLLQKDYLEKNLSVSEFAQKNHQIVKYIEFCAAKVPEPSKRNFLNYCLFNEFNSWEDCVRTKQLIQNRF